jgi:transposase InsO family protein
VDSLLPDGQKKREKVDRKSDAVVLCQKRKSEVRAGAYVEPVEARRRRTKVLLCDNGSEFISQAEDLWVCQNETKIDFSRPGKPTDDAFVESFNGTFPSSVSTRTGSWI